MVVAAHCSLRVRRSLPSANPTPPSAFRCRQTRRLISANSAPNLRSASLSLTPLAMSCEVARHALTLLCTLAPPDRGPSPCFSIVSALFAKSIPVSPRALPKSFDNHFNGPSGPVTPLDATLTKNRGGGIMLTRSLFVLPPSLGRPSAPTRASLTSDFSRSSLRAESSTDTAAVCLRSPQSARSARGEP